MRGWKCGMAGQRMANADGCGASALASNTTGGLFGKLRFGKRRRSLKFRSTPPVGTELLAADNFRRQSGDGRPELEIIDRGDGLDRLLPGMER